MHPGAAFADCHFDDFCRAGQQVAPILAGIDEAATWSGHRIGQRVLRAVQATQQVTPANVNLGIILLIAPLAAADSADQIPHVLAGIDAEQSGLFYEAISLAKPGGVRPAEVEARWDVTAASTAPVTVDLITAMRSAEDRDRIARQYASGFQDWLHHIVPVVRDELATGSDPDPAIVRAQLRLLAAQPDSLITRKCGLAVAAEVQRRAAACWPRWQDSPLESKPDWVAVEQFDRWLRADGNRRNPGTTADLIAAAIYWLIREGGKPEQNQNQKTSK